MKKALALILAAAFALSLAACGGGMTMEKCLKMPQRWTHTIDKT